MTRYYKVHHSHIIWKAIVQHWTPKFWISRIVHIILKLNLKFKKCSLNMLLLSTSYFMLVLFDIVTHFNLENWTSDLKTLKEPNNPTSNTTKTTTNPHLSKNLTSPKPSPLQQLSPLKIPSISEPLLSEYFTGLKKPCLATRLKNRISELQY